MHRSVIVCRAAFVFGLMFCATSKLRADYAALAFSPSTGNYAYAAGCLSLAEAEREALRCCRECDAKIVAWVRNGYIALAVGDRAGAVGWGWSTCNRIEAEAIAIRNARACGCEKASLARSIFSGR